MELQTGRFPKAVVLCACLTLSLAPAPTGAQVTSYVTYLLEGGAPRQRDYPMAARSRLTIDAANESALLNQSFGAQIAFDLPGMAERAMYFGETPFFTGGHASAGSAAPGATWFLAEGATGSYFDTFILIANPNDEAATVDVTYLPATGVPVGKTHTVAGHQRLTLNIAVEDPALASAAVSTQVNANRPVIAERSQYWPRPVWHEAHNSTGETATGMRWGLAEGRVGCANNAQTYILIANPGTQPANITATFLRTNGTTVVKTFTVPPTSRFNIAVTGAGSSVPELADESFGTVIESTQPVIVERSVYLDAGGVTWAAGTNATAVRLP